MAAAFISYRRDDSEGQARALFKDLSEMLGKGAVFMDVDAIALGLDFRTVLEEHLASCDSMLVLIGTRWLTAEDSAGRRLDHPDDYVRQEIAAALKRKIPVTPVLVQGARVPDQSQLPNDLKDLAYRNGFELSHIRWDSDVRELVQRLGLQPKRHKAPTSVRSSYLRLVTGGVGTILVIALLLWAGTRQRFDGASAGTPSAPAPASSVPDAAVDIAAASEQLVTTDAEHAVAREAAIYRLEQIANTSRDHHWQVMEILTAFIRQRSPSVARPVLESEPNYVQERRVDRSKPGTGQPARSPAMVASDFFAMAFIRFEDDKKSRFRIPVYDEPLRKAFEGRTWRAFGEKVWVDAVPAADVYAATKVIGRRRVQYDPDQAVLNLREVNLRYADLSNAYLADADLERADLSDAVLKGACLYGANLTGAMLAGTRMESADLREVRASGAQFLIVGFGEADLRGADFTGTRVRIFRPDIPPHWNRWQAQVELVLLDAYTSDDFREWAVKNGAITGAFKEWENRKESVRVQWAAESTRCRPPGSR